MKDVYYYETLCLTSAPYAVRCAKYVSLYRFCSIPMLYYKHKYMRVHVCVCVYIKHTHTHTHAYVFTHTPRERERERGSNDKYNMKYPRNQT